MARASTTDYLQGFRFHVSVLDGVENLTSFGQGEHVTGEAGFNTVTLPEISADMVEYREGLFKYTRKFQGVPTVSNLSMTRGVAMGDTSFFEWIMQGINGGEYRCDLEVRNYARIVSSDSTVTEQDLQTTGFMSVKCYECLPTRVKALADLDATSAEISLGEVDVELEYFSVETTPAS